MSAIEWVKVALLSTMLLFIVGFPTLVSTQIVTVLGVSAAAEPLEVEVVSSVSTMTRVRGEIVDISFTKPGIHEILRLRNSSATSQEVRLNVLASKDTSVLGQKIILFGVMGEYVLFDHFAASFNKNYTLTVPARSALLIKLKVTADPGNLGYGTVTLGVTN